VETKGRYGSCVCVWQVKLCDPIVTHWPYLRVLEIKDSDLKRYINSSINQSINRGFI